MQLATFSYLGLEQVGLVTQGYTRIVPLSQLLGVDAPATMIELIEQWRELGPGLQAVTILPGTGLPVTDVGLVAPIPHPRRNIICLGKNYRDHVEEAAVLGGLTSGIPTAPVYFSKMIDRVRGSTESVPIHTGVTSMLDYEAELAVIIGRAGHDIDHGSVPEHIFGYSILNDISERDLQKSHDQWFKGKSLDFACAMGPVIVTADEIAYPPALDIRCSVNGELRQKAVTSDLIFDITEIVSDFSRGLTLMPGDIISTGTPAGVGMGFRPFRWLKAGDVVECRIEGIGALRNTIE
ncbi:fumarylacetoacetate hydrolase family protein [Candidatus Cryosericum terrychapinii]|uniref:FAA hydrolase family protein n=1 Tax=Candidatus Cryosericum terrychapinii TaxID=2290919 RepID=A0A398CX58_9BACT|nr:fumarylacetoacetate hydrolase family protein [Candidatus Cryosericum terrychapinii]RIE05849.1 FAA hydrolase family protein [Candidatus Cryosericum terrychapinii]